MLNAEWPWHRFGVTGVYSSVLMMTGLSINVLGPVGPVLMRHLSASPHSIGSIYSAEGLGNFLGSLLLGPVLSRLRPHAVLVGVSALVFLCLGAVPSCSALHQVASLYLLIGLASGLGNATANTSLTWAWHGAAPQLAAAFNLVNSCFPLGGSAAPLVVLASERRVGNSLAAFSAISVAALLPAAGCALLQPPTAPPPPPEERAEEEKEGAADGSSRAVGGSTVLGIDLGSRRAYVRCTVHAPLLLTTTLCIGAEIAYAAWVYAYAAHHAEMRSDEAAYLSSLYWSAFVVGRLSATPLAAYFSPGSILVPSLALEVLSLLALALLPPSSNVMRAGTVGAGVGVSMLFSNILSLLARYGLLTTAMTGALGAFAAIGHMTVPSLAGAAIDRHGYAALMPLLCALNGVGLALLTAVVLHLRANFHADEGSGGAVPQGGRRLGGRSKRAEEARRIASEWSPSPRGNSALDGGSFSGEDWAEAGQGERQRLLGGASRRGSAPTTGTVVV
mmetsp:Transcript_47975/g.154515  ORF Transcript_47975/g.154515 Transcript_47975/m.154515 type:complete len:504 (-) Transcript_47975:213-1724(-)